MLIGTGPDVYMKWRGVSTLLIFAALVTTILAGCGGAGSVGSSEQKTEGAGSSGQARSGRLGHPALGSPDAPVVLTEYSDYQ